MNAIPNPLEFQRQNREFWEDRGQTHTEGLSVTMMAEHGRFLEYVHRAELRVLAGLLSSVSKPRVLDLGCGTGRLAVALAPRAEEIVGIELSESLIAQARAAAANKGVNNVRFSRGSAEDELPQAAFDVVVLSGVLNYLNDATVARCLSQAAATLVPGGLLYVRNHCSTRRAFFTEAGPNQPPCMYRSASDYRAAVELVGQLHVTADRYLFPPLCVPNLVYYHVLPKAIRKSAAVGRVLDMWFAIEERTAEARLRALGRFYPWLLRVLRKPTAFNVLVARRSRSLM